MTRTSSPPRHRGGRADRRHAAAIAIADEDLPRRLSCPAGERGEGDNEQLTIGARVRKAGKKNRDAPLCLVAIAPPVISPPLVVQPAVAAARRPAACRRHRSSSIRLCPCRRRARSPRPAPSPRPTPALAPPSPLPSHRPSPRLASPRGAKSIGECGGLTPCTCHKK